MENLRQIFTVGVEKVSINTHAVEEPQFIRQAADIFGSQSIVVSIDVKKSLFGKYEVYTHGGRSNTKLDPVEHAVRMEKLGAGELFLNSIDRDGTQQGYDIDLIRKVAAAVRIPVIACGGAGTVAHFREAVKQGGASAVSAGSMFVFHGRHRAVLISYPGQDELQRAFA
jgi:cyclase